jgi:hypothetical protein
MDHLSEWCFVWLPSYYTFPGAVRRLWLLQNKTKDVSFQVLMAVGFQTVIFWAVIFCTLVGGHLHFERIYSALMMVCSSKTLVSTYKTTQVTTYKIVVCTGKDKYNKLFYKSVWLHIQIVIENISLTFVKWIFTSTWHHQQFYSVFPFQQALHLLTLWGHPQCFLIL